MDTLDVAATHVAGGSCSTGRRGAAAPARSDEPHVDRWPAWACLLILIGGSAALWAVIGWSAFLIFKLS